MMRTWTALVACSLLTIIPLAAESSAASQKQGGAERFYRDCVTRDADGNKLFLEAFHLKSSKLPAYCRCQADIFRRYENSNSLVTKLSEATFECARKLGGHM